MTKVGNAAEVVVTDVCHSRFTQCPAHINDSGCAFKVTNLPVTQRHLGRLSQPLWRSKAHATGLTLVVITYTVEHVN